jgi:hypothetical protein
MPNLLVDFQTEDDTWAKDPSNWGIVKKPHNRKLIIDLNTCSVILIALRAHGSRDGLLPSYI